MKTRSLYPVVLVAALAPALLSVRARARVAPASVTRVAPPIASETVVEETRVPDVESTAPLPLEPPKPKLLSETLRDDPPPAEETPKPTREEWRAAVAIPLDGSPRTCQAFRIREWLRIRCELMSAQHVALLAGKRDGVAVTRKSNDWFGDTAESVVLPLRRGDRRVITMTSVEMGRYVGNGPVTDAVLSEQWIDGEAAPLVLLSM